MTLELRRYNPVPKEWIKLPDVVPGDIGSLSNILADGTREMYFFKCAEDNSSSTIYRSGFGIDTELPGTSLREITPDPTRIEVVKELKKGESHQMSFKTAKVPEPTIVLFTHK